MLVSSGHQSLSWRSQKILSLNARWAMSPTITINFLKKFCQGVGNLRPPCDRRTYPAPHLIQGSTSPRCFFTSSSPHQGECHASTHATLGGVSGCESEALKRAYESSSAKKTRTPPNSNHSIFSLALFWDAVRPLALLSYSSLSYLFYSIIAIDKKPPEKRYGLRNCATAGQFLALGAVVPKGVKGLLGINSVFRHVVFRGVS